MENYSNIDNGHLNPQYDDLHSANRMALMTEAAVNLAAAMRIGQQQQQNQHQQNNQQNNQQQHQVCDLLLNDNFKRFVQLFIFMITMSKTN